MDLIDNFVAFAKRMGYENLPTRTRYEALRMKKGHAPTIVFTTTERDQRTIRAERGDATKLVNYWLAWCRQKESGV